MDSERRPITSGQLTKTTYPDLPASILEATSQRGRSNVEKWLEPPRYRRAPQPIEIRNPITDLGYTSHEQKAYDWYKAGFSRAASFHRAKHKQKNRNREKAGKTNSWGWAHALQPSISKHLPSFIHKNNPISVETLIPFHSSTSCPHLTPISPTTDLQNSRSHMWALHHNPFPPPFDRSCPENPKLRAIPRHGINPTHKPQKKKKSKIKTRARARAGTERLEGKMEKEPET